MHGYLADKKSFAYQYDFFERDFSVYALDFKGFGENKGMAHPYSLNDYVNELKEFIEKNGITYPHVIAHSFGVRVALKTLYQYPNVFDRLVFTGGAGLKPKKTFKKAVKKGAFNLLKKIVPKSRLKHFYSKDYLALNGVMKESFKLIVNEHLDYVLPHIKNKTLLVFGDKDKETPLYMARRFNKGIVNSSLHVYKGAGHFAFIDKSNKFNMVVREFLLSKD